jgi:hypothetical protein
MAKLTSILGTCALLLAIADIIHGQNNGDIHRQYIHVVEFTLFLGFLSSLEVWAFKALTRKIHLNRWLIVTLLSLLNVASAFLLFAMSGGSFHGDGGPIAFSFLLVYAIASLALPISLIGFFINAIMRKNAGFSILLR